MPDRRTLRFLSTVASAALILGVAITTSGIAKANPAAMVERTNHGALLQFPSGDSFLLHYDAAAGQLVIDDRSGSAATSFPVAPLRAALDPRAVDDDTDPQWLPAALQPYLADDLALAISARRSRDGDGMGYCGAGLERDLLVIALSPVPHVQATLVLESCLDSIELDGTDGTPGLSGLAVRDGRLRVRQRDPDHDDVVQRQLSPQHDRWIDGGSGN